VLADAHYDATGVCDAAAASGDQLGVARPHPHAGQGPHYQSPARLRCLDRVRGEFGRSLYAGRRPLERLFGHAVSFGGGLGALPAWVRGQERVRTWVWAKLLINAVRIPRNQGVTS
jgi:hypothetical protein